MTTATATKLTAAEQIRKLCEPVVKHYRGDLEIDAAWLAKHLNTPCLIFARECGTHLFGLWNNDDLPSRGERVPWAFSTADRNHILRDTEESVRACCRSEETRLIIYFDGWRVFKINPERAVTIVTDWRRVRLANK